MRAMIIALLLIAGQVSASEQVISVQHDGARQVTCWILNNTGITCLPDSSLPQNSTPSGETGRASQVSSASESRALQAIPLLQDIPCNTTELSTCAKSQVSAPAARPQDERFRL